VPDSLDELILNTAPAMTFGAPFITVTASGGKTLATLFTFSPLPSPPPSPLPGPGAQGPYYYAAIPAPAAHTKYAVTYFYDDFDAAYRTCTIQKSVTLGTFTTQ
jgi:hypothetical protein